jgi:hypothetical protein
LVVVGIEVRPGEGITAADLVNAVFGLRLFGEGKRLPTKDANAICRAKTNFVH